MKRFHQSPNSINLALLVVATLLCLNSGCDDTGDELAVTGGGSTGGAMGGESTGGAMGGGSTGGAMGGGSTGGDMGGMSTVVPPMDESGRCFESCLALLSCETSGITSCGSASLAAYAATCQSRCASDTAAISAAASAGCGSEANLLSSLGLTCVDDSLCEAAACVSGETCQAGQCAPYTCVPDQYDTDGNDGRDRATPLPFGVLTAGGLSLCGEDRDWFVVTIPAGASLRVDLGFQDAQGDVEIKAYLGDSESSLASSLSTSDNERLTFVPSDEERQIYLEVYGFAGAGVGPEGMPSILSTQYALYLSTNLPAPICQMTGQCQGDDQCIQATGICTPPPPCLSDADCGDNVCDIPSGRCIECYTTDDCSYGVCNTATNECVTCVMSSDCMNADVPVCNTMVNQCVQCTADTDCVDGVCNENNRCIPNFCQDPQEPDNDLASATELILNNGIAEITGYGCDDDYFTVNVSGGGNLLIQSLFLQEMGDLELEVIDPMGTSTSKRTSTDNEVIAFPNALGGQYQIRVFPYQNATNQYTLRVEDNFSGELCNRDEQCMSNRCDRDTALCLPDGYCESNRDCQVEAPVCDVSTQRCIGCERDPFEPNDELNSAIPYQSVNGALNTCGGPDYFLVEAQAGQQIEASVSFIHMRGDIDLKLYNSSDAEVASSTGTTDTETISYPVEAGGQYFIKVYGYMDVYNEYSLQAGVR